LYGVNFGGSIDRVSGVKHIVNLDHANLSHANLDGADLTSASLQDATLTGATFVNATLLNADLKGANGVDNQQLIKNALDVNSVTLPDGTITHTRVACMPKKKQIEIEATVLDGKILRGCLIES